MNATITAADLTAGTVFTFTKDLTFLDARWANRSVGAHFVVGGLSESGYTFSALNTRTGKRDDITAESWVFEHMRIIAGPAGAADCECECECAWTRGGGNKASLPATLAKSAPTTKKKKKTKTKTKKTLNAGPRLKTTSQNRPGPGRFFVAP